MFGSSRYTWSSMVACALFMLFIRPWYVPCTCVTALCRTSSAWFACCLWVVVSAGVRDTACVRTHVIQRQHGARVNMRDTACACDVRAGTATQSECERNRAEHVIRKNKGKALSIHTRHVSACRLLDTARLGNGKQRNETGYTTVCRQESRLRPARTHCQKCQKHAKKIDTIITWHPHGLLPLRACRNVPYACVYSGF